MAKTIFARCLLILLIAAAPAFAQQKPPDSAGKTCEAFVKEFYSWYLRTDRAVVPPHGVWPYELTMKAKPPALSADLLSGLRAVDAEAQKNQDPGLDFDPVLNTQDCGDPGDPPYLVQNVKVTGSICRADVYNQYGGKTEKIVIPELRAQNGGWVFTNFRYPNFTSDPNSNLVTMIKSYLKMSAAPAPPPDAREGPKKP